MGRIPIVAIDTSVLNGTVRAMAGDGVNLQKLSRVERVTSAENRLSGIIVADGSVVSGSTSYRNGVNGIDAFAAIVTGNMVYANQNVGVSLFNAVFSNNVLIDNQFDLNSLAIVKAVNFCGNGC